MIEFPAIYKSKLRPLFGFDGNPAARVPDAANCLSHFGP